MRPVVDKLEREYRDSEACEVGDRLKVVTERRNKAALIFDPPDV